MPPPSPAVGENPQPIYYNELIINKLHLESWPAQLARHAGEGTPANSRENCKGLSRATRAKSFGMISGATTATHGSRERLDWMATAEPHVPAEAQARAFLSAALPNQMRTAIRAYRNRAALGIVSAFLEYPIAPIPARCDRVPRGSASRGQKYIKPREEHALPFARPAYRRGGIQ